MTCRLNAVSLAQPLAGRSVSRWRRCPGRRRWQLGTDLVARTLPAIRSQFEKGSVYRWALDPWARGAFAVFRPGQMTTLMPRLSRPEGDIHFAGEHTSPWMGWMEGALESGERAAREVLAGRSERRDAVR